MKIYLLEDERYGKKLDFISINLLQNSKCTDSK